MKQIEIISNNKVIHWIVDFNNNDSPFIIYIPWISWKSLSSEMNWFIKPLISSWYNILRFNFSSHEDGWNINNSYLNEEISNLKDMIAYIRASGFKNNKLCLISKSFWSVKSWMINDIWISSMIYLWSVIYFSKKYTYNKILMKKYCEINNLSEITLPSKRNTTIPKLFIHWENDDIITISQFTKSYNQISWNKEKFIISWANHSFSRKTDKKIIMEQILKFLLKNN